MYPTFVETLLAIRPMYWMRLIGGTLYLVGMLHDGLQPRARRARARSAVDTEV